MSELPNYPMSKVQLVMNVILIITVILNLDISDNLEEIKYE